MLYAAMAPVAVRIITTNLAIPATVMAVLAAIVTNGMAPDTKDPNFSLISPKVFSNCFCLPLSVLANSLFIWPTLSRMISASIAARWLSVPYCITFSCVSLKEMPTRFNADVWPCMALPMRLAMLTASPLVALRPFCCANKSFMAGSRVSMLLFSLRKVATCCAPASCTSSPITPISCCALAKSFIACMSASVAFMRWRITVSSCRSACSCTA